MSRKDIKSSTGPGNSPVKSIGGGMMALAWLVLIALLTLYFIEYSATQFNPNDEPETIERNDQRVLVLKANSNNHFVMTGRINGKKIPLILDTGATNVAVPADLAKLLGLKAGRKSLAVTANGPVEVYSTQIESLQIGEIVLGNVRAELNPGMNGMNSVLLGMSALSRISFSLQDGELTLVQ